MPPGSPQFGQPPADGVCRDRPGAYAVALVAGKVLVVETPAGRFLPGGGREAGESAEAALHRELREETGYRLAALRELGSAGQYVVEQATGRCYNKRQTFFLVELGARDASAVEPDHTLRWLAPAEALATLREEAQAWAVRRARDARSVSESIVG
ncbi:MAG TPA: NUDIX domain-containing protein [Thermomicrobiaceae bacterium]|nr:NUDIX domain-containing protein [Thermomicrobiaceae bacterium]